MSKRTVFIGHRQVFQEKAKERLVKAIQDEIDDGCRIFAMGTHGQFDALALWKCKVFREKYPDIEIEVIITSYHKVANKLVDVITDEYGEKEFIYDKNINYTDVKTKMFEIEDIHPKRQITESNKQMIDECDTLICYVDPKSYKSGAKTAMNYAKRKSKKIINTYDERDEATYGMTKEQRKEYFDKLWESIKKK